MYRGQFMAGFPRCKKIPLLFHCGGWGKPKKRNQIVLYKGLPAVSLLWQGYKRYDAVVEHLSLKENGALFLINLQFSGQRLR